MYQTFIKVKLDFGQMGYFTIVSKLLKVQISFFKDWAPTYFRLD